MTRKFLIAAVCSTVLALSAAAFAQQGGQFGNADEAKTMLLKAIAAVKADKTKALDMFNKGEGGFLDRDIYPFCINFKDGIQVATQIKPTLGADVRTFKDATGRNFGQELFDAMVKAKENEIVEFSFMFPRPGSGPTPVQKVAFVMKSGDIYCGVGYYK
jgi:hypothetical protein